MRRTVIRLSSLGCFLCFSAVSWAAPALPAKPSQKSETALVVKELAWTPHQKVTTFSIVRSQEGASIKRTWVSGEKNGVISETDFMWLQGKLLKILFELEAKQGKERKCQEMLQVKLLNIKQSGNICSGDFGRYHKIKGYLSAITKTHPGL